MRFTWIATLIAAAFAAAGVGCALMGYFSPANRPENSDVLGWIIVAAVLMLLALIAGAAAAVFWVIEQFPH